MLGATMIARAREPVVDNVIVALDFESDDGWVPLEIVMCSV